MTIHCFSRLIIVTILPPRKPLKDSLSVSIYHTSPIFISSHSSKSTV
nr:MAG TPA: hypothetical protein [Caudoviricetes sp.]